MKKVMLTVALVLGLGLTQARAQMEEAMATNAENKKEQNVFGRIFSDIKESARTVHEINKENLAAERSAVRTMYSETTEADPAVVKFRQAKGFKNKMNVVADNIRQDCKEYSEKGKVRREQIKSHEAYRLLLEEQRRVKLEAMTSFGYKG